MVALALVLASGTAGAQEHRGGAAADTAREEAGGTNRIDVGGYGSLRLDGSSARQGEPAFALRRLVLTTEAHLGSRFQVETEAERGQALARTQRERAEHEHGGGTGTGTRRHTPPGAGVVGARADALAS